MTRRSAKQTWIGHLIEHDDGTWAALVADQISRELGIRRGSAATPAIARNLLRDFDALCDCVGVHPRCRSLRRTLVEAHHRFSRGLPLTRDQSRLHKKAIRACAEAA